MAGEHLFLEVVKKSKSILDIGCGPKGSDLVPEGYPPELYMEHPSNPE